MQITAINQPTLTTAFVFTLRGPQSVEYITMTTLAKTAQPIALAVIFILYHDTIFRKGWFQRVYFILTYKECIQIFVV